jgi:hypothetical protein
MSTEQQTTSDFIKVFNSIAKEKHRYKVFSDFVSMSAIALQNVFLKSAPLEDEYMSIVKMYSQEDVLKISTLFHILVQLLEPEPRDILGELYMNLEFGNAHNAQFFTPPELSLMLAHITFDKSLFDEKPFITMSEPASGAGGMILSFVKIMIENNINPAEKLYVECTDIDKTVALMCYIQLSLWGIPAEITVGNSLSMEIREKYYTSTYFFNKWDQKLKFKDQLKSMKSLFTIEHNGKKPIKTETKVNSKNKEENITPSAQKKGQSDLFGI